MLIIYNAMLFAVIALLVGATPVTAASLSPLQADWLRRGIMALAALALIVSIYALAAIIYRTCHRQPHPQPSDFHRLERRSTSVCCSCCWSLQVRARAGAWVQGLQRAFAAGAVAYAVWALVVILALPWLFSIDQGQVKSLPPAVQRIVYEEPQPILLKCAGSPHIYLLDDGEKRWIKDIATFDARGFGWRDVQFITCTDLRALPDGRSIPADAGPPPQP